MAGARGEVHLLELEPGDLHEEPAGERVARAVAGAGVSVRGSASGQWAIVAAQRGLLRVATATLAAVNRLEGMSVFTLFDGQVVDAGEVVAARQGHAAGHRRGRGPRGRGALLARAGGCVAVRRLRAEPVGAVVPASLTPRARARFEAVAPGEARLVRARRWCASRIRRPTTAAVGRRSRTSIAAGARIVVVAGANALDPLDPVFTAIERVGGRLVRHGVPAHPGSLLWVARVGEVPVLGMPACGMFSQATLFDLLLPRLLAGRPVGPDELAAFGHGGLLGREMAFRFPPYRAGATWDAAGVGVAPGSSSSRGTVCVN